MAEPPEPFDLVIMNPPYKKLAASSRERKLVSSVSTETSNLYSAFMALGVHLLRPGGQLLAITPRSFANGPYFRLFRRYFLERMHLDRVHVFGARNKVFADTAVLQENVILHQFAEAGLVIQNPDRPDRPTNSPQWCYQIEPAAYRLITAFKLGDFSERLEEYLIERPSLQSMYAREREMSRVPLQLPGGKKVTLSPGGQNVLIAQVINEFCERYTPNGEVLYIGDSDDKWQVFEKKAFVALGVEVDHHGKMPDVVVYLREKNWLVLIETASSHGPVDHKRYRELSNLFQDSTAGLVFISALPSRIELRKYLKDIAWETDVWCADNPTHLIHFNGERFLGPYS